MELLYIPKYITLNMKLCTVHISFLEPNALWFCCGKKELVTIRSAASIITDENIGPEFLIPTLFPL
jgi:hypothetical protein